MLVRLQAPSGKKRPLPLILAVFVLNEEMFAIDRDDGRFSLVIDQPVAGNTLQTLERRWLGPVEIHGFVARRHRIGR